MSATHTEASGDDWLDVIVEAHCKQVRDADGRVTANILTDRAVAAIRTHIDAECNRARLNEWNWIKEHSYANESDASYQLLDKDEAEQHIATLEAQLSAPTQQPQERESK